MAFGIKRAELHAWKKKVDKAEIAFITHFWRDARFPNATTVTKVGCGELSTLIDWGMQYGLKEEWIHHGRYPHFDLFGKRQKEILIKEAQFDQMNRFNL